MLAICSGLEILPASTCAGSPPTQLKRKKISRMTPAIVGIICHSLRITYAVTSRSLLAKLLLPGDGRLLGRHVDIEVLEVRIQDRMLLVSLDPRVLQVVVGAMHAQPPGRIHEDQPDHLAV